MKYRMRALRRKLRPIAYRRQQDCGNPLGPIIGVHVRKGHDGSPSAHFQGVATCGSAWACPCCSHAIATVRAEHVRKAVEKWGAERCFMASFTMRHTKQDEAKDMVRGVSRAFTRLITGAPWKKAAKRLGLRHHIRGSEPTYGENGWHAHLHVVFMFDGDPELALFTRDKAWGWVSPARASGEREHSMVERGGWEPACADEWLNARWQTMVTREMGDQHRPDWLHGLKLTPIGTRRADYLAKLGLEISDGGHKEGRGHGRSPWQIASDYAEHRRAEDAELFLSYCDAYHGMRKVTWSRGTFAELVGGDEAEDEEIAAASDQTDGDEDVVAALIPAKVYVELLRTGRDVEVLMAAEAGMRGDELLRMAGLCLGFSLNQGHLSSQLFADALHRSLQTSH